MIYIKTYGCTFNKSDSQAMMHILGKRVADSEDQADIVIFNTCGVKLQTENKVLKDIRAMLGKKRIIVAGCLPFIDPDAIPNDVDAVMGPDQIQNIASIVDDVEQGRRLRLARHEIKCPKLLPQCHRGVTAIIPISLGCKGSCTYCATKFARGDLRSYPRQEIVSGIEALYKEGYREFQLTSQDTGCYGMDIGSDLPSLLSSISALDGDFRVRVGMLNPNHAFKMLDELLESYESDKIFKFLHLPVQSGSDSVLKDMNRFYTTDNYLEMVDAFRDRYPGIYIATDIIVGFPGESEEDFQMTLDLTIASRPDKVNITRYSVRPGTVAADMKQFPDRIKKDRSRVLSRLVHNISGEINQGYVGKDIDVLVVEEGKKGRMVGRMENYKPVICDGYKGEFKKVRISEATSTYLVAE